MRPFVALTLLCCCSIGSSIATADPLVRIRLEADDLAGNPITQLELGGLFRLQAFVQDLRPTNADGVFGAYTDITFDPAAANPTGPIVYSPTYPNVRRGTSATPGLLDDVGAVGGIIPLGSAERLLFSQNFQATQTTSNLEFLTNPADDSGNDVLLYGLDTSVPPDDVSYGSTSLAVFASNLVSVYVNSPTTTVPRDSQGTLPFTLTLSQPSGFPVSVHYATRDGSAHAGTDYTSISGTLNFPSGVTTEVVEVPILPSSTFGYTRSLLLDLSAPVNLTIDPPGSGLGTFTVVPEPSSCGLAVCGLLCGIGWWLCPRRSS